MWTDFVVRRVFGYKGERLRDFFDDLELELVIPKLLLYIYEIGSCDNVIWLLTDEFKSLRATEVKKKFEPEQQMHRHLRIQAIKNVEEPEVRQYVNLFEDNLSMSAAAELNGRRVIAWPIVNVRNQSVLAYVLMTDVKAADVGRLQDRVGRDLSFMCKHIGFSFQHWEVQRLSYHDDLTGLYNQKYLSLVLENEILRSQRNDKKFSVLFMDIDYFKMVNDTRGHWVGSHLLVEIGRVIKQRLRKSDYAFRYGGDEFVAVLPGTTAEGAKVAAERLRHAIETTDFVIDGQHLKLTMSLGLAAYPDHAKTHKDIIKMADEAMYCGKNKSRNIVFVAS